MRSCIGFLAYAGATLCAASTLATAPEEADVHRASARAAVERPGTLSIGLSDEAAMLLAGTALIGVAAAVRRAR